MEATSAVGSSASPSTKRRTSSAGAAGGPLDSLSLTGPEGEYEIDVPDPAEIGRGRRRARGGGRRDRAGALLELPLEQRQAIVLSDVHGYHYEEIARMTGANVGTVKSRIHRGRERLRALLSAAAGTFRQSPTFG
ncbi:MAG: sigma factor-like helix-turn-helix DNA-binding protein [Bifidobacterium adolescentis]